MAGLAGWLGGRLGLERWRTLPVSRRRQILTPILLGTGLLFPFVTSNAGNVDAAANAFTYVLLALGLNIVVGFAGLLDLGYAAFFAIGAYGYGVAASGHLKPEWSSLWIPLEWAGQVSRLVVPGQPDTVQFHFAFWPSTYSFLGLGLVAVSVWISIRLQESRLGRAWMAIREDELAAGAMGVNHVHYKLMAFAMGAAVGGLGGTFYVAKLTTATPDMFTFPVSVMVLVMVVLGGLGSIRGVVMAALFVAFLQSVILQELTEYVHALGRLVGSDFLQRIELITSLELIFGLILV